VTASSPFAIDVPAALLVRVRRGDVAAFEQLYRLFERPAYALALRMLGDREEALEAAQDTLLKVFERIGDFRGEAPLWGWLRRIAVNEALMRLRRRTPLDYHDTLPEPASESDPDPFSLPPAAAESAVLERALAELPPLTRSVLWLYHGEGYTHDEIGALMGRSRSFSKSQLARGTRRLRELLIPCTEPEHA
jgi:RNA polymerase sigma factor (sigma-70 family)